ncbi:helix-turn-helix transcriptional regulator [Sphingobacterium sp. HJSM2_6]|uniref:helix-turn-helix transcriptional regulator n=1 Tax=Sphingobacterium sp. HJSM2_6 TaxID=3366264 RepID=UPI003BDF38D2
MINIYKELQYPNQEVFAVIESVVLNIEDEHNGMLIIKRNDMPNWVTVVKDYIIDHWNKPISLEELANLGKVHRVTISKYYSKYTGSTVLLYQRKIRIIRSIEYIKSEKYSLTEIAFLCGFADQSHFTRYFRQTVGYLPKYLLK